MKEKENYKGTIISAAVGGAFFAIPYLALSVPVLPAIGMAALGFGASSLIFSEAKKEGIIDTRKSLYETLNEAKSTNASIYSMIKVIEDDELVKNIKEIHDTAGKIIDTISKNPSKLDKAENFFSYYLPVTLKLLKRYDDIENQNLSSKDSKKLISDTDKMITKINVAYKNILDKLYQSEIIDTDVEMKVFDTMLKSDGFNTDGISISSKEEQDG